MRKVLILAAALALSACAQNSQNGYMASDVGHPVEVSFGTIVQAREISIQERSTGAGAGIGVLGGAAAGAGIGHSPAGFLVGMIVGGIAGAVAENAMDGHGGYEYTVTLENGRTITVAQNKANDVMLTPGMRCIVQTGLNYARVLPANQLPEKIKRPKKIEVQDAD